MADLKLGPLPKQRTVPISVVLAEPLKEELDAYAAEHSKLHGAIETAELIPHMVEAFLRSDRAWRKQQKQTRKAQNGKRRVNHRPSNGLAADGGAH